jgi:hypothetical protein
MTVMNLPPIQPYFPTTFLERGVAVPFTTPLLYGSRARPAQRGNVELVLPNPTGGRGVYVLAWESVREFCHPTVHDRQLILRITALPAITPNAIRHVARAIAAEGMAGEEAMEAALATAESGREELVTSNYMLLMKLIEQVDATVAGHGQDLSMQDLERRAQIAVARIAPQIGKSAGWVATALEALADVLCDVGINARSQNARMARMLDLLQAVRSEIAAWSRRNDDDILAGYATMICDVADVTLSLAATTVNQAQALTRSVVDLLRTWANDPGSVTQAANRPEWLLDGWEQICRLWRQASQPATQRAALAEIAQLVPVLPREAMDWAGITVDSEKLMLLRRFVPLNEDWRTGAIVFELIARNEHLLALGV